MEPISAAGTVDAPSGGGQVSPGCLVSSDWLNEHLDDPGTVVLEMSHVTDEQAVSHVPGAITMGWRDLLWDSVRREFADPEVLAARLGTLGIGPGTDVVLGAERIQFSTYTYWALMMLGHPRIHVLDGGLQYWRDSGFPVTRTAAPPRAPVAYQGAGWTPTSRIDRDAVLAAVGSSASVIVDLRSDEEYEGLRVSPSRNAFDHGAEARGRIPGAHHLYFGDLLAPDGRFLSPAELRSTCAAAGVSLDRPVILYCRLGHRASLGWFCLSQLLGFEAAFVYDGSWTEWGSMVGMPVERSLAAR